jgi:hypothetical protein
MGLSVSTKSSSLEHLTYSPSPVALSTSLTSLPSQQHAAIQVQPVLSHFSESLSKNCQQESLGPNGFDIQSQLLQNVHLKKLSASSHENTDGLLQNTEADLRKSYDQFLIDSN